MSHYKLCFIINKSFQTLFLMFSLRINTLMYYYYYRWICLNIAKQQTIYVLRKGSDYHGYNWPSESIHILLTLGYILGILQQIFPLIDQFFELPLEDGILPETDEGLKRSPFLKSHVGPHMHTWLLYWIYHYLPGTHPPESNVNQRRELNVQWHVPFST